MLYLGTQRRCATFGYLGYVEVNRDKKSCHKIYVGVSVLGSRMGLSATVPQGNNLYYPLDLNRGEK